MNAYTILHRLTLLKIGSQSFKDLKISSLRGKMTTCFLLHLREQDDCMYNLETDQWSTHRGGGMGGGDIDPMRFKKLFDAVDGQFERWA